LDRSPTQSCSSPEAVGLEEELLTQARGVVFLPSFLLRFWTERNNKALRIALLALLAAASYLVPSFHQQVSIGSVSVGESASSSESGHCFSAEMQKDFRISLANLGPDEAMKAIREQNESTEIQQAIPWCRDTRSLRLDTDG